MSTTLPKSIRIALICLFIGIPVLGLSLAMSGPIGFVLTLGVGGAVLGLGLLSAFIYLTLAMWHSRQTNDET